MALPIESEARSRVPELLGHWLASPPEVLGREVRVGDARADLVVRASGHTFLIEVKSGADIPSLERAAVQLGQLTQRGQRTIPLLVVPFMGPRARTWASERGLSWLDLSGNADIRGTDLRILVSGEPDKYASRGRPTNAFAPRYARVTRVLLATPERSWLQKELAAETGLPEGTVSKAVGKLLEMELIERNADSTVRVVNPATLLDAWGQRYRFEDHHVQRFGAIGKSGPAITQAIAHQLEARSVDWCATGLSAAWQWTRYADYRLTTIYVANPLVEPEALGLHPLERGENVWLVTPRDTGVFYKAEERDGVRCAHPVQVYVDLLAHPERAREAAMNLRSELLGWKR